MNGARTSSVDRSVASSSDTRVRRRSAASLTSAADTTIPPSLSRLSWLRRHMMMSRAHREALPMICWPSSRPSEAACS